jgi:serine/threonine protein kinase
MTSAALLVLFFLPLSALFMAPEMLDGDTSDVKSDIWSVGITAIQMAQGRPPHYNLHPARVRSSSS